MMAFETFGVPAFFAVHADVLALYASASSRTTGLCIRSCDGFISVTPVGMGFAMRHAASLSRTTRSGAAVTDALQRWLWAEQRLELPADVVRTIKEAVCYVPLDYYDEITRGRAADETGPVIIHRKCL